MSTTKDVTIEISGPLARIDPPSTELLRALLTFDEVVCHPGGPLGYRLEHRQSEEISVDPDGRLVTYAGLVPKLVTALMATGRRVKVVDVTAQDERLLPDRQLLDKVVDEDRAYLDAVTANRRGQVVSRGDWQLVRLLELARRVYPEARTLIVACNRRQVRFLKWQLRRRLKRVSASPGFDPGARVLIVTMQQFLPAMEDPSFFGLVLLVDADRIVSAAVSGEALGLMGHRRVYGYIQPGLQLSQRERLELEGVCGPVIYESPGPFGQTARVQVVLAEPPLTPVSSAEDALDYKRKVIWHDDPRNKVVADLATLLAAGRDEELYQQGLLRPDVHLPAPSVVGRRVVVLVESTEHGLALKKYLPGWRFFTASTATVGERLTESGLPSRSIITLVAASTLDQLPADVLMRAGGGEGPIALRGFPPASSDGRRDVVVIDLADDSNEAVGEATRSRLRTYARLGWQVSARPGGFGLPRRRRGDTGPADVEGHDEGVIGKPLDRFCLR